MYFTDLTSNEFQSFVDNHFSHYTQSADHYQYRAEHFDDAYLVGVKNDAQEIVAACLLTKARSFKFFNYFYTHRGPVMDYNNIELVNFFFKNLTQFLKKYNCLYVLVDPYILESVRNAEGEILDKFHNDLMMKELEQLGYKHQGYTTGYSEMSQIRWLSVLDLKGKNGKEVLNQMDYQTRRNIKKTYEMGVEVRDLSIEETPKFYKLFHMAEEKHGFKFRDEAYFKYMQQVYGDHASLKLAYVDLNKYLNTLNEKNDDLTSQISQVKAALEESPNSKKQKNKYNQLSQQLDGNQRKINETKEMIATDGSKLDLAAALYIYNEHEVYYLSSGSNPKYNRYMGAYRLQWEMIKFALEHNIDRYNFYGVTGDFSDQAEDYGVQQFKKGFDAHIEEYIGDFIKPIKPFWYNISKLFSRFKN
ncbi:aminoacyltransferase [Staphylococcus sp. SQ8-PEA]|uniref:Aminoacyltransferase FemA n=1 Tax=Staphylococcus marylandisciuri TaxID=2981529 RepID=A0ABT2QP71_9STAP|nr:aminoacyltransferase [Staphylococcus marylandisciuri]MCU5745777.1 aminoacyltransferase [Staphylococcus marylandisciuri]